MERRRLLHVLFSVCAHGVVPKRFKLLEQVFTKGFCYFHEEVRRSILFGDHLSIHTLIPLFIFSVGFCVAYDRSKRLWVPLMMYARFNWWNLVCLAALQEEWESAKTFSHQLVMSSAVPSSPSSPADQRS